MGVKATPGRQRQALEKIASGRLSDVGAVSVADAYSRCIMAARVALGECRHCRGLLIGRCSSCDELHASSCCECEACMCPCSAEEV